MIWNERGEPSLSEAVRELAADRKVAERTVWRWLPRVRAGERIPERHEECRECGKALPADATIRRRYCDDRCRVSAHRRANRAHNGRSPRAPGEA